MTIALNSLSGRLLISIFLGSFSEVLFFSLECILFFSFCLTVYVCFYELGETVTFSSLKGVALCRNVPCIDCVCLVALFG